MLASLTVATRAGLVAACVAALQIAVVAPPASAQTPLSLQGESLSSTSFSQFQATCSTAGSSMLDFTVSGTASGPYPGTFEETGHITIGAQTTVNDPSAFIGFNSGPVAVLHVNFTIHTANGDVSGTKELAAPMGTSGQGACATIAGNPTTDQVCEGLFGTPGTTQQATLQRAEATTSYDAVLPGSFRDTGSANATVSDFELTCTAGSSSQRVFSETFTVSNGVVPLLPTAKEQCKDGGWQVYGVFKNQGDCESFVATGGKNPPANP